MKTELAITILSAIGLVAQVANLPASKPEPAIVLPGHVTGIVDGDTLDVRLELHTRVRLVDCWAPETRTTNQAEKVRGQAAAKHLTQLAAGKPATVTVPIQPGSGVGDLFSFGRLLARVQVDGTDLSQAMIDAGHATETKQKPSTREQ